MALRSTPDQTPTRSVQTVNELQQIETAELLDGDQAYTIATNQYWRVNKSSSAGLSATVRQTRNSANGTLAGRWFLITSAIATNDAYARLATDITLPPLDIPIVSVVITTTGGALLVTGTASGHSLSQTASTMSLGFTITPAPIPAIPSHRAGATSFFQMTGTDVVGASFQQRFPTPANTYTITLVGNTIPPTSSFIIQAGTTPDLEHADLYVVEV